jgi:hypothetical protein
LASLSRLGWGILFGFNQDAFDLVEWQVKTFCISVVVKFRKDNCVTRITTVYGPAYVDKIDDFLSELHDLCDNWDSLHIIGGDFNMVRGPEDKNNG